MATIDDRMDTVEIYDRVSGMLSSCCVGCRAILSQIGRTGLCYDCERQCRAGGWALRGSLKAQVRLDPRKATTNPRFREVTIDYGKLCRGCERYGVVYLTNYCLICNDDCFRIDDLFDRSADVLVEQRSPLLDWLGE